MGGTLPAKHPSVAHTAHSGLAPSYRANVGTLPPSLPATALRWAVPLLQAAARKSTEVTWPSQVCRRLSTQIHACARPRTHASHPQSPIPSHRPLSLASSHYPFPIITSSTSAVPRFPAPRCASRLRLPPLVVVFNPPFLRRRPVVACIVATCVFLFRPPPPRFGSGEPVSGLLGRRPCTASTSLSVFPGASSTSPFEHLSSSSLKSPALPWCSRLHLRPRLRAACLTRYSPASWCFSHSLRCARG